MSLQETSFTPAMAHTPHADPFAKAGLFRRATMDCACTVEVAQNHDTVHAHVTLDSDLTMRPGDSVRVHGAPITVEFGESFTLRRTATVTRASRLEEAWTRLTSWLGFGELYDVSFTGGKIR